MNLQTDLFGEQLTSIEPPADHPAPLDASLRTLAVPCGFMNNKNTPCRRLGSRPVMLDGSPFVCRGVAMVHCEPDCFCTDAILMDSHGEDEIRWDQAEQ